MVLKEFLKELEIYTKYFSPEALAFYQELVENQDKLSKNAVTENGVKILNMMQDNLEKYSNIFSSKQLGELLFMSPRSVSGSMKKLINDGYVEKKGGSPVCYGLTDLGKDFQIDKQ